MTNAAKEITIISINMVASDKITNLVEVERDLSNSESSQANDDDLYDHDEFLW